MAKYEAVIFCGGYGTRMRDFNSNLPKPLVPILDSTILDIIIENLKYNDVNKIYLLTGYKQEQFIKKYSGNNYIVPVNTGEGTDTAERLMKISGFLKGKKYVLTYGDSITNFNLAKALKSKDEHEYSMALFEKIIEYGVIEKNLKNEVNKIHEKNFLVNINAGFYLLDDKIFELIERNNLKSFENEVLPLLINKKLMKSYVVDFWQPIDSGNDVILFNKKYNNKLTDKPWCI